MPGLERSSRTVASITHIKVNGFVHYRRMPKSGPRPSSFAGTTKMYSLRRADVGEVVPVSRVRWNVNLRL